MLKQLTNYQYYTTLCKNTFSLLLLALTLTACQTPPLDVYHSMNSDVDLSRYQTFSIQAVTDRDNKFTNFINKGIENNLNEKGYQLAEESDLVVIYSLQIEESEQLKQKQIPVHGTIYTQTSMEAVFEAKMLVNIIDSKTGKVIWKAATSRDLRRVNANNVDQAKINDRMNELFESF